MRKGWDKTRIRESKNQTKFGPKSSIKPEPKLFKYPNEFKILVVREPKPNPIRTEVFREPDYIRN